MKKIKKQQVERKAVALSREPTKEEIDVLFDLFLSRYVVYLLPDIIERKSTKKKTNELMNKAEKAVSVVKQVVEEQTKNLQGIVSWRVENGVVYYE